MQLIGCGQRNSPGSAVLHSIRDTVYSLSYLSISMYIIDKKTKRNKNINRQNNQKNLFFSLERGIIISYKKHKNHFYKGVRKGVLFMRTETGNKVTLRLVLAGLFAISILGYVMELGIF